MKGLDTGVLARYNCHMMNRIKNFLQELALTALLAVIIVAFCALGIEVVLFLVSLVAS